MGRYCTPTRVEVVRESLSARTLKTQQKQISNICPSLQIQSQKLKINILIFRTQKK